MAHEMAHNYGYSHPSGADGDTEYDYTVTQRARACVENFNALPGEQSRTLTMPGEVEMGYHGRTGGSPFDVYGSNDEFISGLDVSAGSSVEGIVVLRTSASSPLSGGNTAVFGSQNRPPIARHCDTNELLVGIYGRSSQLVDNLGLICAPASNLSATRLLPADGGSGGRPFMDVCPAGKAVRARYEASLQTAVTKQWTLTKGSSPRNSNRDGTQRSSVCANSNSELLN
jgi:hypothetical protein